MIFVGLSLVLNTQNQGAPASSATADSYFQNAAYKRERGDAKGAIEDYTRVIEIDPRRADAYLQRGKLTANLDDIAEAFRFDPASQEALRILIDAKNRASDWDGVISLTTRGLELHPSNEAQLYFRRAAAREQKGDIDGAIEDINRSFGPADRYNPHGYRAQLFYRKGAWKEALGDFVRERDTLGRSGQKKACFYIWILRFRLGQKEEADKELAAFLENEPRNNEDDWARKMAGFLLGRMPESAFFPMEDASGNGWRSWQVESRQSTEWYFIGMKRLLSGDRAGAVEGLKKSVPRAGQNESVFAQAELRLLGE